VKLHGLDSQANLKLATAPTNSKSIDPGSVTNGKIIDK
jgi:hypothetical protein